MHITDVLLLEGLITHPLQITMYKKVNGLFEYGMVIQATEANIQGNLHISTSRLFFKTLHSLEFVLLNFQFLIIKNSTVY